jgi:hypothetical protein
MAAFLLHHSVRESAAAIARKGGELWLFPAAQKAAQFTILPGLGEGP